MKLKNILFLFIVLMLFSCSEKVTQPQTYVSKGTIIRKEIQDYATVSNLRNATTTPTKNDKVFITELGLLYYYDSSDITSSDDSLNIIRQGSYRWKLSNNYKEEKICLNETDFIPADINDPKLEEVLNWSNNNLTTKDTKNGTLLTYYSPPYHPYQDNIYLDFVSLLSEDNTYIKEILINNITVSDQPIIFRSSGEPVYNGQFKQIVETWLHENGFEGIVDETNILDGEVNIININGGDLHIDISYYINNEFFEDYYFSEESALVEANGGDCKNPDYIWALNNDEAVLIYINSQSFKKLKIRDEAVFNGGVVIGDISTPINGLTYIKGKLGINTNNPVNNGVHIADYSSNASGGLIVSQSYPSAVGCSIRFLKSRGNILTPQIAQNGDKVGSFAFGAYDGTKYLNSVMFGAALSGVVSTNVAPMDFVISVGNNLYNLDDRVRLRVAENGNVTIGSSQPTCKLDIESNKFRLRDSKTPTSSNDTGNQGDICWDSNYLYICIATNSWKRIALSNW